MTDNPSKKAKFKLEMDQKLWDNKNKFLWEDKNKTLWQNRNK